MPVLRITLSRSITIRAQDRLSMDVWSIEGKKREDRGSQEVSETIFVVM